MSLKRGDKIIHLVKHVYSGRHGEEKDKVNIKCYIGEVDHVKTKLIMINLLKDGKYYLKAVYPESIEKYTEATVARLRSQYGSSFLLLR